MAFFIFSIFEPSLINNYTLYVFLYWWPFLLHFLLSTPLSPPKTKNKCSVQFGCSVVSNSLRPHELQHARPPCPSPSPGVHSNSRPSSRWSHPAISSSVVFFSSCPQSLPASESFPMSQLFAWGGQSTGVSESFPMSQLFAWGGQSTGVSALASFLPKNTQGWSPLEWTGWISLQSKGLSRVFNTTVQKHQFFSAQLSSQSNSQIHTCTSLQMIPHFSYLKVVNSSTAVSTESYLKGSHFNQIYQDACFLEE